MFVLDDSGEYVWIPDELPWSTGVPLEPSPPEPPQAVQPPPPAPTEPLPPGWFEPVSPPWEEPRPPGFFEDVWAPAPEPPPAGEEPQAPPPPAETAPSPGGTAPVPSVPSVPSVSAPSGWAPSIEGPGSIEVQSPASFEGFPMFTPPTPPAFQPFSEVYPTAQPFVFTPFEAPTLEQAMSEPGYEFARREGLRALEQAAAARGILRSGGTLKDLMGWGNAFAQQNYANVFNRALEGWQRNLLGALSSWQANEAARQAAYGLRQGAWASNVDRALDTYDRLFNAALAAYNPRFRAAELTFEDLYRRWRDALNAYTALATAGAK